MRKQGVMESRDEYGESRAIKLLSAGTMDKDSGGLLPRSCSEAENEGMLKPL